MNVNNSTYSLFEPSNFDAYDRGPDRYSGALLAGLEHHGLQLSDVYAVTQDFGLWAICSPGLFHVNLVGLIKKRIEVDDLIPYTNIHGIEVEPTGSRSGRIVLTDAEGGRLAEIDFRPGKDHSREEAVANCERVYQAICNAANG